MESGIVCRELKHRVLNGDEAVEHQLQGIVPVLSKAKNQRGQPSLRRKRIVKRTIFEAICEISNGLPPVERDALGQGEKILRKKDNNNYMPLSLRMKSRKQPAEILKSRGNAAFSCREYTEAVKHYTEALDIADASEGSLHLQATIYGNRAAAFLALRQNAEALTDAELSVQYAPDWPKGAAKAASGDLPGACEAYLSSLDKEEAGADVRQTRNRVTELLGRLFAGMGVRRQLQPGEQPRIEDLEPVIHPAGYAIFTEATTRHDHALQEAVYHSSYKYHQVGVSVHQD
eukprot:gene1319-1910_t